MNTPPHQGQLVLKMGNLDLAAFCVRHAADLGSGLGQSPTQQAIVQTFLKNYDKVIVLCETRGRPRVWTRPEPHPAGDRTDLPQALRQRKCPV